MRRSGRDGGCRNRVERRRIEVVRRSVETETESKLGKGRVCVRLRVWGGEREKRIAGKEEEWRFEQSVHWRE